MNLFVMSDKQGSGKTFIIAGLAATMQSLGYSVGYYKPIQTGSLNQNGFLASQDVAFIKKIDPNLNAVTSYVFQTDAIPILAAKKENIIVKPEVIVKDYLKLRKTSEIVFVESCGGLMTPLARKMKIVDLVDAIQTSVLLVVEPTKDVLEKVLLMINYARHNNIDIRGIILNKFIKSSDLDIKKLPALIEAYSGIPIVGIVRYQAQVTPSGLIDTVLQSIDLETIFGMKIPKLNIVADS